MGNDFKDFIEWCKENIRIIKYMMKEAKKADQQRKEKAFKP